MNILVLNGSPKGDLSVTLQYAYFIQKKFPQYQFKFFNISQLIEKIEHDEKLFNEILDAVKVSQGVLWVFPVYYLLVPSQYKRFIELIMEKGAGYYFKDKYAATLSTSVHFFDHTAHMYMSSICGDLGMKYAGSFSVSMYDLLDEAQRKKLVIFAQDFFDSIENNEILPFDHYPLLFKDWVYMPREKTTADIDLKGKRLVVVVDQMNSFGNLSKMLAHFKGLFKQDIEIVDLSTIDIKGGCLGCCHCAYDYTCVYQDGFKGFCDSFIRDCDILIFAGRIRDRYLSWRWKLYFDRSFFRTHTPMLDHKQVAFILQGPLSQIPNLKETLDGYMQTQGANLAGFITDERADSAVIDSLLKGLARRLVTLAKRNYVKPMTFLGVAGHKIMRDCMWSKLQFPFQADHLFYVKHGLYDFPRRSFKAWLKDVLMTGLTRIPFLREKIYCGEMKKAMVEPLKKILASDRL